MFFSHAYARSRYLFAALAGLAFAGTGWAGVAGRVNFVNGEVNAVSADNKSRLLVRGDLVNAGDRLETGAHGRIQIRFTDGGVLALQPNSSFRIDRYSFSRDTPDQGALVFQFLRGSLRTISGAIGKINRANYQLSTPMATIGIRGTDYSGALDDGLLKVRVTHGRIALDNPQGSAEVAEGQTFDVRPGQAPVQSATPLTIDALDTEEELPPQSTTSVAVPAGTAVATTGGAAAGIAPLDDARPRLENFASYNLFLQAMYAYKKAESDKLVVSDAAKQMAAAMGKVPDAPEMNMQPLTEAETGPTQVVQGPESLEEAVNGAAALVLLSQTDRSTHGRSTYSSFPMKAEDPSSLQSLAVSNLSQLGLLSDDITASSERSLLKLSIDQSKDPSQRSIEFREKVYFNLSKVTSMFLLGQNVDIVARDPNEVIIEAYYYTCN